MPNYEYCITFYKELCHLLTLFLHENYRLEYLLLFSILIFDMKIFRFALKLTGYPASRHSKRFVI